MDESFKQTLKTFWALMYKEMMVVRTDLVRMTINYLAWGAMALVPVMFFMPTVGMPADYSLFMLAAFPTCTGCFDIPGNTAALIGDIVGARTIEYELSLPVPQWAIFVKIAIANAYKSFMTSIAILPFGALFVYYFQGITFTQFNFLKFLLITVLANLFYGFVGIFMLRFMYKIEDMRNVWMRFLFPLWFIGGFNASWAVAYKGAPKLAYFLLLNPMVYVSEGTRAAILGQEGFLNFWCCIGVIIFFILVFGIVGVKTLQLRLDCL